MQFDSGEHTRPRVFQSAPSPTVPPAGGGGKYRDVVGGAPTTTRIDSGEHGRLACRSRRPRRLLPLLQRDAAKLQRCARRGRRPRHSRRVCSPDRGNGNPETGLNDSNLSGLVRAGAEVQRSTRILYLAQRILESGRLGRHFADRKHLPLFA